MHAAHGIDFLVPLRAGLVRSRNCAANGVELLSYIPELHIMASADRLFGKALWADSIDTYGTITYHVWNANSLHMNNDWYCLFSRVDAPVLCVRFAQPMATALLSLNVAKLAVSVASINGVDREIHIHVQETPELPVDALQVASPTRTQLGDYVDSFGEVYAIGHSFFIFLHVCGRQARSVCAANGNRPAVA